METTPSYPGPRPQGIDVALDPPLEITTDGDVLMLRPVRGEKKDRVRASAAKMVKAHAKTLAELAK